MCSSSWSAYFGLFDAILASPDKIAHWHGAEHIQIRKSIIYKSVQLGTAAEKTWNINDSFSINSFPHFVTHWKHILFNQATWDCLKVFNSINMGYKMILFYVRGLKNKQCFKNTIISYRQKRILLQVLYPLSVPDVGD